MKVCLTGIASHMSVYSLDTLDLHCCHRWSSEPLKVTVCVSEGMCGSYLALIHFSMPVSSGVCILVCLHGCRHAFFFRNSIIQPCISLRWKKHCWAFGFHHAVQARDVNQGTRQGSAQCLIWTTLLCLRRVFYYKPEEEEAQSLYRINNILVRFLQDMGWWRKQI